LNYRTIYKRNRENEIKKPQILFAPFIFPETRVNRLTVGSREIGVLRCALLGFAHS
jgi:hypothetical protein